MRRVFLRLVARLALGAPILTLTACALLTLAAAVNARRLFPVETDVLALLPDTVHEALIFRRSLQDFHSFDYLLAVIEHPEPDNQEILVNVAGQFSRALLGYGRYIQSVEYVTDADRPEQTRPDVEERLIPALLTDAQLGRLDEVLHGDLEKRLDRIRSYFVLPISAARRKALLEDPLGLERIVRFDRIQARGPIRSTSRSGLAISADGRMALMVIKPSKPATDLLFSEELMGWLRRVAHYAVDGSGPEAAACRIEFIGSHVEAENDATVVRRDLAITLAASFVLVVLLFILAVRRIGAIFFVGVPLVVGAIWTLGVASLLFDQISVVTCIFGVALFGLGIDYAIHLYNRYLEERMEGREVTEALETTLCETGQGVLVGAMTTAVGFCGMYLIRFEGLQELGIIGATGVLCCLAAMLLVLPPLIVVFERLPKRLGIRRPPSRLGLGRLAATVQGYPVLTLTVGLLVTAYLGFFAQRIGFDDDLRHLRKSSPAYEDLIRRTANRFELPSNQVIAIVSAPTLDEALELNDRLYRRLEEARRQFPILGFDSLRTILPSVATQRRAHAEFHARFDLDLLEERLRLIAKRKDLATTVALGMLDRLREWNAAATDQNLVRFGEPSGPAFETLIGRVDRTADICRIVTHIYPRQRVWGETVPEDFVLYLHEAVGSLEITGLTFVADALKRNLIHGMVRAVLLVILAVFFLLVLHFRSVRKAIVATIPVLCSVIWTLGTLHLMGIQLNFLNVIVIPLIVGLGIDDGVHILQRYYEGGKRDLESAVEKSGRAVVVTSLTTMMAFGTLSFSTFQGVREIGLVAIMGVGFALIASILLVPALLRLVGGRLRLVDLFGGGEAEDRD